MKEQLPARHRGAAAAAIVSITLAAPTLGGSTELWALGALGLGVGVLLIWRPPSVLPALLPTLGLAGLILLALTAFLPASWLPVPHWRSDLVQLGAVFPATRTPQPWITFQWVALLWLILIWTLYVLGFEWGRSVRQKAYHAFGIGIVCLAGVVAVSYFTRIHIPFWPTTTEFGSFPNRNQTSNVLGVGGIVLYAIALRHFEAHNRDWWLWFAGLCLICGVLILEQSRAGVILFFGGALAVHLFWWSQTVEPRRSLVGFIGLGLLIALFIGDGGATAARFGRETFSLLRPSHNFRWTVHQDALALAAKNPFLGIGLGNFRPVFAFHRAGSASSSQLVHPESDWIWGIVDLGWGAPLLVLLLLGWWARNCFPFASGTNRLIRFGAMVAVLAFAIHGFFDVSAHRAGALWPALFLAAIATNMSWPRTPSRWLPTLHRLAGISVCIIGIWWIASALNANTPPTTVTVDRIKRQTESSLAAADAAATIDQANQGLRMAALEWSFYFERALGETLRNGERSNIQRDFTIARYLFPYWPSLYQAEAETWLNAGEPDLAFSVWKQGIIRLGDDAPVFYRDIYSFIKQYPDLVERWRELADDDPHLVMVFFRATQSFEFELELDRVLRDDPDLARFSTDDLRELLNLWYKRANKLSLAEWLQKHPERQNLAWAPFAQVFADTGDFHQACDTFLKFVPRPEFPRPGPDQTLEQLSLRFEVAGSATNDGLKLAIAAEDAGDLEKALAVVKAITNRAEAPRSAFYLQGELLARKGEWKEAWEAFAKYEPFEP